jgi:Starch-binding associating with outer membrane
MKKIIYISLMTIIVSVPGCTKLKDFGNTNSNPATTSIPVTEALLTSVLSNLGTIGNAGYYCQYFSETSYPKASLYSSNSSSPMNIYSGILYDIQNIINTNSNEATKVFAQDYGENENQIAISRILKAYIFWTITNSWGDVPYSDALKEDPNVKYDSQESLYKDMIKELTEAVSQFIESKRDIKGDIAYNGNIAKWKKLSNSLRMLMALNLSKQYPGASDYSAVQFKAALADPAGSIISC